VTKAAVAVALLLLGVLSALASIAVHPSAWFPLAVATPLVTAYAAAPGLARAGFVVGWFAVLAIVLLGRPEGDFAIAGTWQGYGLLLTGLVLLAFAVATVPRPHRRPS
jgi:hypothetical protein